MSFKVSILDKSFLTNAFAMLIIALGWYLHSKHITPIGYYALSGAITNWLAIYMLFERVPFLYGSGVIPNRFESFKRGIKSMIMQQFFGEHQLQQFIREELQQKSGDFSSLLEGLDFDALFDALVEGIESSSLGGMLSMFGGREALMPMKPNIVEKLKSRLETLIKTPEFEAHIAKHMMGTDATVMVQHIEHLVDKRLEKLTPNMVKDIIQAMIREHLGWLVVWGGVFGGLIGFVVSYL